MIVPEFLSLRKTFVVFDKKKSVERMENATMLKY